ncbi:hypothetical protein LTR66_011093 [Elasticomyces elasticus]|nr:hypothetical protein LTR66_011093 [Elasticomyces elasticus]
MIHKAHELAARHGAHMYVVIQFNGKFHTYNSVNDIQWPSTIGKINQSFPLPEVYTSTNVQSLDKGVNSPQPKTVQKP